MCHKGDAPVIDHSLFHLFRCKNFFKRSVVTTRPFLCKGDNTCDIRLYDERGVRRKTSRCQACRYGPLRTNQIYVLYLTITYKALSTVFHFCCTFCRFRACLDQGMSHGGPRVGLRGGRHHRDVPKGAHLTNYPCFFGIRPPKCQILT